jgi:hypothetical protein
VQLLFLQFIGLRKKDLENIGKLQIREMILDSLAMQGVEPLMEQTMTNTTFNIALDTHALR